MGKEGLILVVLFLLPMAMAFTPEIDSPIAKQEHPRMHITKASLEEIRDIISSKYKTEYQAYVDEVINDLNFP